MNYGLLDSFVPMQAHSLPSNFNVHVALKELEMDWNKVKYTQSILRVKYMLAHDFAKFCIKIIADKNISLVYN